MHNIRIVAFHFSVPCDRRDILKHFPLSKQPASWKRLGSDFTLCETAQSFLVFLSLSLNASQHTLRSLSEPIQFQELILLVSISFPLPPGARGERQGKTLSLIFSLGFMRSAGEKLQCLMAPRRTVKTARTTNAPFSPAQLSNFLLSVSFVLCLLCCVRGTRSQI